MVTCFFQKIARYCLVFAVLSTVGCGTKDPRKKDLVPVSGVIVYNGEAVAGAVILFHHEDVTRQGGGAISAEDGTFKLNTYGNNDGTYPGNYIVTVSKEDVVNPLTQEEILRRESEGKSVPGGQVVRFLPDKYRAKATSDIRVTVPPKGIRNLRIELTD